ncbi:MAG: division/cell wall cluster transcriptional repressor MraZ [Acidimicrobiia bacterium]|nr:division/cell wall cluster transcriptional repressor MraZ [Acidimicrobiia bacterium]
MFLGEFQHNLDEKGRMVLPRKFRDALASGCFITKGQERCLYIFPAARWEAEVEKVNKLPRTDRRARNFARSFFAGASDQVPDGQGRIAIPPGLRAYASLEKEATVVGVADRVEVWSSEAWTRLSAEADEYYADIGEQLSEEGI